MAMFDESQGSVFELDTSRHARILGAPGTGKTLTLVEAFARITEQQRLTDQEMLVLTPGRITAAAVRAQIEQRVNHPLMGTPVRTPVSFAYAALRTSSALAGMQSPRLLTGALHDEAIQQTIANLSHTTTPAHASLSVPPEVVQTQQFRDELREFDRVCHEYHLTTDQFESLGRAPGAHSLNADTLGRWQAAAWLRDEVNALLNSQHERALTTAELVTKAAAIIAEQPELTLPRLVLVDNAHDLLEGAVLLLAALAERGCAIWVFGDPDISVSAFQGERTALLRSVTDELARKTAQPQGFTQPEQLVVLSTVYRHDQKLRSFVQLLSQNIGTAGLGQQRQAQAEPQHSDSEATVQFVTASLESEQSALIAHVLRQKHLGLGGLSQHTPWSDMAVICRTSAEVRRISAQLNSLKVPTQSGSGAIVLREHPIVHELVLLMQFALGIVTPTIRHLQTLLTGVIGGEDTISLRRLRRAVYQHVRELDEEVPVDVDGELLRVFVSGQEQPVLDLRAARSLSRLGALVRSAAKVHQSGGTPREVLWQIWQTAGLSARLQNTALGTDLILAEHSHATLDAVMALFFALQREEEQHSGKTIDQVLDEIMQTDVAQDTIARRASRDAIVVATTQSLVGREFEFVAVAGVQDAIWPNTKARGSLLKTHELERLARGEQATPVSRRETIHDELRLFTHAVSRARSGLLVVAVANEEQQPSAFFELGADDVPDHKPPSSRLSLRGVVAEMRRRLVLNPEDTTALASLCALVKAGVPAAHPDEWYGVRQPTTQEPLVDLIEDSSAVVPVSPSHIERIETCPLNWFVQQFATTDAGPQANIGTLLHYAIESAEPDTSGQQLFELVREHWSSLRFEASWQSQQALEVVKQMSDSAADYLRQSATLGRELIASEARFEITIDRAVLRGSADRVERSTADADHPSLSVVDFKTGAMKPSAAELRTHAQLMAYQLAAIRGEFGEHDAGQAAHLVYLHPNALTQKQRDSTERFAVLTQQAPTAEEIEAFEERVSWVANTIAANGFTAEVEHHCANPHAGTKACAIHVIPAVNNA